MDASAILAQLQELNTAVLGGKPAAREQMLIVAQNLVATLQTPSEFISNVGWAEPARFACLRTAVDLKIFETLDNVRDDGASAAHLAKSAGAEPALVARIMKHLVATNVVLEKSKDVYVHTKLSSQFTNPQYRDGIVYCYDVAGPSFRSMPSFFQKTQYKHPLNPIDGPFQHGHDTTTHFFPWLSENPTYLAAFANYMSGYRAGKCSWFSPDFYPVQKQLITGFTPSSNEVQPPFLVDVGGGKGHDILAFSSAFPDLPGSLVLQDKTEVVDSISPPLPSPIIATSHDFFTPQSEACHGSRAYFLHSVLHDWDDASCIKILQTLKTALIPGYSKVLVHDLIVPDEKAAWSVTSMDMLMMALGSVKERTETEFRALFEAAGLQVVKVWMYEQGTEGLIEAILPAGS